MPIEFSEPWTVAIGAMIAAFFGAVLDRRLPGRLGLSLCLIGVTTAVVIAGLQFIHPDAARLDDIAVALALAALFWTTIAALARRDSDMMQLLKPAAEATAMVAGVGAGGILIFAMGVATRLRVIEPDAAGAVLNAEGLIGIGVLAATVLVGLLRGLSPLLPTAMLFVCAMAGWWISLIIPSVVWGEDVPASLRWSLQPGWWTWTFNLQSLLAGILICGAIIQDRRYRSMRAAAWPDRLDDLLLPFARWPGYGHVEAVLAAIVLVLGVFQIVRPSLPGWELPLANAACAMATGLACLYMTYRRWSTNTALLGMTLLALFWSALACAIASPFVSGTGLVEYAERIPIILNAVLFGLWIAIAHWLWLGAFWEQQLLDGTPWTTAGRLIPHARTICMYLAALAVVIAFQMAVWPERARYPTADDGTARLVFGLLAIVLLLRLTTRAARRLDSHVFASTAIAFAVAIVIFVVVRLPYNRGRGWLMQYGPVVLAAVTPPLLLLAERLERDRAWRLFAAPIWFVSLLFIPAVAISQLLGAQRLAEGWIQPATLLVLAITYAIAGLREHRRAFLVLAAVLCLAAFR